MFLPNNSNQFVDFAYLACYFLAYWLHVANQIQAGLPNLFEFCVWLLQSQIWTVQPRPIVKMVIVYQWQGKAAEAVIEKIYTKKQWNFSTGVYLINHVCIYWTRGRVDLTT